MLPNFPGALMSRFSCCRKLLLFALLSVADFALTWLLLHRAGDRACEKNPVAFWWLDHFGWAGLAGFKLGIVGVVAILVLVVARHRPPTARKVLRFGCSVLLAVVLYSGCLLYGVEAAAGSPPDAELGQVQERTRELDRQAAYWRKYHAQSTCLRRDLGAGRRTLAEAVAILVQMEQVGDMPHLRRSKANDAGRSREAWLAARLMLDTLRSLRGDSQRREQVARDLEAQFRSRFAGAEPGAEKAFLFRDLEAELRSCCASPAPGL
jgi:hypothetical protein